MPNPEVVKLTNYAGYDNVPNADLSGVEAFWCIKTARNSKRTATSLAVVSPAKQSPAQDFCGRMRHRWLLSLPAKQ
jgi:hypothetical protein